MVIRGNKGTRGSSHTPDHRDTRLRQELLFPDTAIHRPDRRRLVLDSCRNPRSTAVDHMVPRIRVMLSRGTSTAIT